MIFNEKKVLTVEPDSYEIKNVVISVHGENGENELLIESKTNSPHGSVIDNVAIYAKY